MLKTFLKRQEKTLTDFVQSIRLKKDSQVPKQTFLLKIEKILIMIAKLIYSSIFSEILSKIL
jgi:hypothetical protein